MIQPTEKYSAFLALIFSGGTPPSKTLFFLHFFVQTPISGSEMCKLRKERDISDQHKTQNMNLGLVNMSKTGDGLDVNDIIIYFICAICVLMVLKWLKKCYNRRLRQAQNIIQPTMQPVQPAMQPAQPVQFQQLHVPALPQPITEAGYRVHYR